MTEKLPADVTTGCMSEYSDLEYDVDYRSFDLIDKQKRNYYEKGMVTAEFAVVTPVFVLFLVALLAAANVGFAQVTACSEARSALRAQTLGEVSEVKNAEVSRQGDWVSVTVSKPTWAYLGKVKCELKTISEPHP